MEILCSNAAVLESFLSSAVQAAVVQTAIVAAKSVVWSLFMMGTLPNGIDVLPKEPNAFTGFPFAKLHTLRKPGPENKDASDTDDDDDDEEDEAADDQDEDGGEDEDGSDEDGEDGDPEGEPQANGDGGSGDDDDEEEDDDEDDDDDDDAEEEEDDDEEDEEELPQPPTKKRK